MAALISLSLSKNLVKNCLCDFHPDLARRCFHSKMFQNQPKARKGGWWRPGSVSVQWGLDLPEEPTLPLTPSMYVRENGALAVFFLFLFNRLLHGCVVSCFPAKVFVRLGSQCVLKNWLAIEPFARLPRLETDASYTFNCWKSFCFSKMIFLFYWELRRSGEYAEQAWGPCFQQGSNSERVSRRHCGDSGRWYGKLPGSRDRASWEGVFFLLCFVLFSDF